MSEVFLSYRQTDDAQRERVRAFGERLRSAGITVILDQLFLDDNKKEWLSMTPKKQLTAFRSQP